MRQMRKSELLSRKIPDSKQLREAQRQLADERSQHSLLSAKLAESDRATSYERLRREEQLSAANKKLEHALVENQSLKSKLKEREEEVQSLTKVTKCCFCFCFCNGPGKASRKPGR